MKKIIVVSILVFLAFSAYFVFADPPQTKEDCYNLTNVGACYNCMEELGLQEVSQSWCDGAYGCPNGCDCDYAQGCCDQCCLVCG